MKTIFALLTLLVTTSFASNKGVYLNEMRSLPTLRLTENTLNVNLSQSLQNTAIPVATLNVSVDHKKKRVILSATKTTKDTFKDSFVINLLEFKVENARKYMFYWQEPNKVIIKLALAEDEQTL